MTRTIVIATLALSFGALSARAQERETADGTGVEVGQRVRITSGAQHLNKQIGTVIAADDGTITLQVRTPRPHWIIVTDTLVVSRETVDRQQISRGKHSGVLVGALLGAVAGALVGGSAAAASYEDCTPQLGNLGLDCIVHDVVSGSSSSEARTRGAVGGGILGCGLGALLGATVRWERWDEVRRDRAAVSVRSLASGRVGLGVGIRF
jgi:hypothetical protein